MSKGRRRRAPARPRVFVFGAGKVGSGLTRALRDAGCEVRLVPQRRGLPSRIDADVVVLAVRDRDLAKTAEAMARDRVLCRRGNESTGGSRRAPSTAVVHCAGALGPEVLDALRASGASVAQMHPMISFADRRRAPSLDRGQLHVDGDPHAVRAAKRLGRLLGMTPRTIAGLDRVAYHAAAGLVANGAAALAAGGAELLASAGVAERDRALMLGPLLRSVAENVERLGMPEALTGPVRRGDVGGVERHLQTLDRLAPRLVSFYVAAGLAQVPHARALGEGAPEALDAIERLLRNAGGQETGNA